MIHQLHGKVHYDFDGFDSFTRVVMKLGNSAHVRIPIEHLGKRVKIVLMDE